MKPIFYCFFVQGENVMEGARFAFGSVTDERIPSLLTPRFPAASGIESRIIHPGVWKAPEFGLLVSQSDQQYAMKVYAKKKNEMYSSIKTYLIEHEDIESNAVTAALELTEQYGIECIIPMTGKIMVGVPVGL